MPAIANGTGFVGFGNYLNDNKDTLDREANDVSSGALPGLQSDVDTANADIANTAAGYGDAVKRQIVGDYSQANNWGNAGPDAAKNYEDVYRSGGKTGAANPYSVQNPQNALRDPNQIQGYGDTMGAINKAQQDQAKAENLGTWGGAFDALRQKYGGPGSGFDASLLQGRLSSTADAARGVDTAGLNDRLSGALSTAAGGLQDPTLSAGAHPARPAGGYYQPGPTGHGGSEREPAEPAWGNDPMAATAASPAPVTPPRAPPTSPPTTNPQRRPNGRGAYDWGN